MEKIVDYEELHGLLEKIKSKGTLVLVGGCFDILHPGHIEFLNSAKTKGDILLVILESDESVKKRKGENRPINNQQSRANSLAKIKGVDYILLLPYLKSDLEYYNLVKTIEPDIIAVTEGDPAYNKKVEQAKLVGGKVIEVIKRIPKHSTTRLVSKKIL